MLIQSSDRDASRRGWCRPRLAHGLRHKVEHVAEELGSGIRLGDDGGQNNGGVDNG